MAIYIKNPEALRLARELSALTGETMITAITVALRERLDRVERKKRQSRNALLEEIRAISDHCASLPVLDTRTDDEIMGWNENGLPS